MANTDPSPITVYYNSACPVCDAGIRSQKERMQGCNVQWVDVHGDPAAAQEVGAPLEAVRERLHVKDAQGRVVVGADAFEALWSRTPGQHWLARLAGLPGLRGLARWAYDRLARALYRWNRRNNRW